MTERWRGVRVIARLRAGLGGRLWADRLDGRLGHDLWRGVAVSLSHVLVGEGWGEGDFDCRTHSKDKITLTLTLSHEYVGEGTRTFA